MRITPECTVFRFRRPTIKYLSSYTLQKVLGAGCDVRVSVKKRIPTNARENTADVRGKKRT